MVEVYLPPTSPHPIRCHNTDDARLLFEVFSSELDEVMVAALGSDRELRAILAFDDVDLATIVDDPGPVVMLATGCGAKSVIVGHLVSTVTIDGDFEVTAQRTLGAAFAVDGLDLDGWITLPAFRPAPG